MTPACLGPLTVQATFGTETAALHAVAVPAPRGVGRVPLVGVGYSGITSAIMALALSGAATVYGKLDVAVLVAIADAIVGYSSVDTRPRQAPEDGGAPAKPPSPGLGMTQ